MSTILHAAKMYEHDHLDNALANLKTELPVWRNQRKDNKTIDKIMIMGLMG